VLQAEVAAVAQARQGCPDALVHLGGMNRIQGFMGEPDGELILLGAPDAAFPPLHLEDLVISLRNAYQVSPAYQGTLGCSIDARVGAVQPWRIQAVSVFGMPATTMMAARHVTLDYELKKVSAGLVALGEGMPSLYELARAATPLCEGALDKEQGTEMIHRFWFYPLYPAPPRFVQDEGIILIRQPVDVQLLTEREFFDRTGRRTGAAPADPLAEHFAQRMTQLLATNQLRRYAHLRNDFRIIEVGQLLRFMHVPTAALSYVLQHYPLTAMPVPAFIGGVRRDERSEVVCEHQLTERQVPKGKLIESSERLQRYRWTFQGGVEAQVRLATDHFVQERSGALASLRRRVRASRPGPRTLLWAIAS
jgi:hypothetical protein